MEFKVVRSDKATHNELDRLSQVFMNYVKDAVDGRLASGIEEEWTRANEYYEHGDLKRRIRYDQDYVTKEDPLGVDTGRPTMMPKRSQIALNITRPFTDTATSRLADLVTKSDRLPFGIAPTPVQHLEQAVKGEFADSTIAKIKGKAEYDGERAGASEEEIAESIEQSKQDAMTAASEMVQELHKKAAKAEKRIKDWFIESKFMEEFRGGIDDGGKLGTMILKGPFALPTKKAVFDEESGQMEIIEDIKPHVARMDPWNCYPDPSCGENIHNGEYFVEKDWLSRSDLRKLADTPGFFKDQIIRVLKEGPQPLGGDASGSDKETSLDVPEPNQTSNRFELYTMYKTIELADLVSIGGELPDDSDVAGSLEEFYGVVSLVNGRIIGIQRNILEGGPIPYHFFRWSEIAGQPWGHGMPFIIMRPQQMANAATRAMMDNAGRASGPMIVYDPSKIAPARGGPAVIMPWAVWEIHEDSAFENLGDAFQIIDIDMHQESLQRIVEFAMQFAEKVTDMPWLTMGQQAGTGPAQQQTTGAVRIMNENAGAIVRRLGARLDDHIIEPLVRMFYDFLLQYGPRADEKGDINVVAQGAIALLEKDLEVALLEKLTPYVGDPTFGIDPEKFIMKTLDAMGLKAEELVFTDQEKRKKIEEAQAPPPDPAIQAAEIRAKVDMEKIASQERIENRKVMGDLQIDAWRRINAEIIAEGERDVKMRLADIAAYKTEGERLKAAEEIKERMAETRMKLDASHQDMLEQIRSQEHIEEVKADAAERTRKAAS